MRRSEARAKSSPPPAGPGADELSPDPQSQMMSAVARGEAEKVRTRNAPMVLVAATPGTRVVVTIGMQKFSPVQYHTFDVGPFSLEVEVQDESYQDACARGLTELKKIADLEFEEALKLYVARVKRGLEEVRRQGLRS